MLESLAHRRYISVDIQSDRIPTSNTMDRSIDASPLDLATLRHHNRK
mgnify:FL=1